MQTILLTGATDGLGKDTAFTLAAIGYNLILHGRNQEKGEKLLREIKAKTSNKSIHYYNADFAELAQIKALAETILANHSQLDVLINNAGLGVEHSRRESKDGLEILFQVDYLSNYILINKLLPILEKAEKPHVINVSSAGQAPVDFSDPLLEKSWSGIQAYCQAKLSQITLALALAEKYPSIRFNAVHPASYMPTKIVTHMFTPQSSINDGVQSVVKLVTDKSDFTGKYFFQTREQKASNQAYDKTARAKLLKLSKELTGI